MLIRVFQRGKRAHSCLWAFVYLSKTDIVFNDFLMLCATQHVLFNAVLAFPMRLCNVCSQSGSRHTPTQRFITSLPHFRTNVKSMHSRWLVALCFSPFGMSGKKWLRYPQVFITHQKCQKGILASLDLSRTPRSRTFIFVT